MNNNTDCANRQRELEQLALFLERLSRSVIYLKILSAGTSSIPAFNGELDTDEVTYALLDAFFNARNLTDGGDKQLDFETISDKLEIASLEISAIARSMQ